MSYIDGNIAQSFDEYFDEEVACYGLQALTDSTNFNDALDDLQDYIEDNEEDEMGYEISRTDNVLSTNFKQGEYGKVRLATPNGTYMVKIRDFAVLRKIFGSGILGNSIFRAQKKLHRKIFDKTNKNSNENDYLRSFLLAFKELKESNDLPKTPIFLYKLNESTNTFEKVNLNVQDNPATLPCN